MSFLYFRSCVLARATAALAPVLEFRCVFALFASSWFQDVRGSVMEQQPTCGQGLTARVPRSNLEPEPGTWNLSRCNLESMCRNIKTLANFEPPATGDEIRASALQFVRKLSGMNKPSRANEAAFNRAVEEVTDAAQRLIASVATSAPPRNREEEARKAQERARERFA